MPILRLGLNSKLFGLKKFFYLLENKLFTRNAILGNTMKKRVVLST